MPRRDTDSALTMKKGGAASQAQGTFGRGTLRCAALRCAGRGGEEGQWPPRRARCHPPLSLAALALSDLALPDKPRIFSCSCAAIAAQRASQTASQPSSLPAPVSIVGLSQKGATG